MTARSGLRATIALLIFLLWGSAFPLAASAKGHTPRAPLALGGNIAFQIPMEGQDGYLVLAPYAGYLVHPNIEIGGWIQLEIRSSWALALLPAAKFYLLTGRFRPFFWLGIGLLFNYQSQPILPSALAAVGLEILLNRHVSLSAMFVSRLLSLTADELLSFSNFSLRGVFGFCVYL